MLRVARSLLSLDFSAYSAAMILSSFLLLLPILILASVGFLLTRLYGLSQDTLVKVIMDALLPMLIFHALYTSDISFSLVASLAGVITFVVAALTALASVYVRLAGIDARDFIPSVIFMNSGLLGIPLMQLWGGLAAMNLIVIYDQIQTVYIFTLGLFLVIGGFRSRGLKAMVVTPILWAIVLGFAFRLLRVPLPEPVLTTLDFGGRAAPPLAALAVGVALGSMEFHFNRHLFAALTLRFAGGYLAGWAGCLLFGLEGLPRTVVLVASALPSAVLVSVLPVRYGLKADFGATMVVVSTLLGLITIPLSFYLAG